MAASSHEHNKPTTSSAGCVDDNEMTVCKDFALQIRINVMVEKQS